MVGIYEFMQLWQTQVEANYPFLVTASCFWSSAFNTFILDFGITTITLYDLAVMFRLKPDGVEPNPMYEVSIKDFDYILSNTTKYGNFLIIYLSHTGEVIDAKHVVYLLY